MLNKLREKAHVFWLRHRGAIIGFGVFTIGTVGVGMAVSSYIDKKDAERAAAEAEAEEARKKAKEEADAEEEKMMNDPANKLTCGGYIRPDNDWLYEPDEPYALANCVPISAMGEFGQNIISRMKESLPSEEEGYFNIDTAVADVIVDFGHQVWLNQHQEESQEKQAP